MKKKIIGIFVCMLMMTTSVLPIVDSDTKTDSQFVEEKDCGCSDKTYNLNIFSPPVMTEIPQFSFGENDASSITLIDTPEYFNWKDNEGQDWTTPARDQGQCGSCWLFGALGALESVINIREGIADLDIDLSEQYVLSCLPRAGSCKGGDASQAFKFIQRNDSSGNYCNGIIPELCFSYQGIDTVSCDEKCVYWQDYLIPISAYGILNHGGQREAIKSAIMQKGPLVSYVFTDMSYNNWLLTHHSPDDYLPYELSSSINHVILIVGWKDDSSIGKGGYWICKDSWGTIFGYDGFFNIEYESRGIEINPMVWVDYDTGSYDWHPVPQTYGPYYGLTSQPLQFKGNASGEHPPFTWLWDFGDGTTSEEQNPIHTYLSPGNYDVTLTVTDVNNKSFYATTSAWIQETNQPPQTPIIEGPKIISKGTNWRFNYTVNDPDGGVIYLYLDMFNVCPGLWYGPWPSNEKTSSIFPSSESGAGAYTVRMKAKDPYGAESDWATLKVIVMKSKAESLADIPLFFHMIFLQHPLFEKILGL